MATMRTNKQIIDALNKSGGIVAGAAKMLGMNRSALSRRIGKSPELKAAYEDVQESTLDLVESKLLGEIQGGNITAMIFYLKCKGKKRGFVERYELQDAEEMPSKVEVEIKDCSIREDGE